MWLKVVFSTILKHILNLLLCRKKILGQIMSKQCDWWYCPFKVFSALVCLNSISQLINILLKILVSWALGYDGRVGIFLLELARKVAIFAFLRKFSWLCTKRFVLFFALKHLPNFPESIYFVPPLVVMAGALFLALLCWYLEKNCFFGFSSVHW